MDPGVAAGQGAKSDGCWSEWHYEVTHYWFGGRVHYFCQRFGEGVCEIGSKLKERVAGSSTRWHSFQVVALDTK